MNAFWESLCTKCFAACECFRQVNSSQSLVKYLYSLRWLDLCRSFRVSSSRRRSAAHPEALPTFRPPAHPFCFCGSDVGMISWSREEKRRSPNSLSLSSSLSQWWSRSCVAVVLSGFGTDGVCSGVWVRLRFRHVWRQCLADPEHPGICETRDSRRAESCGAEPIHTSGPGHTSPGGRNNKQ